MRANNILSRPDALLHLLMPVAPISECPTLFISAPIRIFLIVSVDIARVSHCSVATLFARACVCKRKRRLRTGVDSRLLKYLAVSGRCRGRGVVVAGA